MALKFLNKKGWHTGSLRNIENVWKAEQKHDAEQKKLEELRKQIHEERERSEFRQLQEQAGLVPRQERLEFLYDSGLAVGKTSEGGSFKALEAAATPKPSADAAAESSSKQAAAAAAPGALFEEKPQSANDTWRKLHSDPLLMIRQREQEALARVKNNPVQMAMIRKSIESKSKKEKDKDGDKKEHKAKGRDKKEHKKSHDKRERREKRHHTSSKHQKHSSSRQQSDSDNDTDEDIKERKSGNRTADYDKYYHKRHADSGSELSERDGRSNKSQYKRLKDEEQSPKGRLDSRTRKDDDQDAIRNSKHDRYSSNDRIDIDDSGKERENKRFHDSRSHNSSATELQHEARHKRRYVAPKLSEEERAARLREMQMDAEVHEEQRWKRLKKAEDDDAREASLAKVSGGRNFLDAAHRSVYGAEKGGSSTIEESVRRRTHYRQGRSEASEGNAFRR